MFLREFKLESIADLAVIFHKTLNPLLWDKSALRPEVQVQLLKIARHFIEFINIPNIRLQDITISGSNAAFTYTENSDIDLHLVVDIPFKQEQYLKSLFDAKKNQYNFNHDIEISGIAVELYVQKAGTQHHSAGIYSILNDTWISKPTATQVKIDDDDVTEKVINYASKIKQALNTQNLKRANAVLDRINKLRKTGLEEEGEFSIENIAFKVLRAKGLINKLREHIYDLEDRELSLEDLKNGKQ
jgi:hypothetical protein